MPLKYVPVIFNVCNVSDILSVAEKAFEGVGGKLHCVIGLSSPIKAKTSFSPPFMWKPANEWGWKDAEETPTPAAEDREGPADPGTRT